MIFGSDRKVSVIPSFSGKSSHSVHCGIAPPPPLKNTTLLFLATPPLNLQIVHPLPFFRQSPPLYRFFVNSPPIKVRFFSELPKY